MDLETFVPPCPDLTAESLESIFRWRALLVTVVKLLRENKSSKRKNKELSGERTAVESGLLKNFA